jgi:ISXO2-like transposase domain
VRAAVVDDASVAETERILSDAVAPDIHLMSDEWSTFMALGSNFAAHDTVQHSEREYARGIVHVNSVEGFNAPVRRTVAGVFHHISPRHADLYLTEIGFRWSQRTIAGQAVRKTRKGREVVRALWERVTPARQFIILFRSAVGRQLRRTREGSIAIKSSVAAFG